MFGRLNRGLKNRPRLHFVNLGEGDAQTHTTHPQHRIEFGQPFDPARHIGERQIERFGQFLGPFAIGGQKFMQRRIKQPDAHWQAFHDPKQLNEIRSLHW